jgi:peptidylprolyl isomerase
MLSAKGALSLGVVHLFQGHYMNKAAGFGDKVTITYLLRQAKGGVVEPEKTSGPLTFRLGSGRILPKLEEGVVGMIVGERRTVAVAACDGYGEYNKQLVLRVDRKMFPPDLKVEAGRTVQYQDRDGERVNLMVNEVTPSTVTVDGNHPLAGLDLLYEVELLSIDD